MGWTARIDKWQLLTVSDPAYDGIRFAAIAPGCDNRPHDGTECGCRMFTVWSDGDTYIRGEISAGR